jgi:hypothetical protein
MAADKYARQARRARQREAAARACDRKRMYDSEADALDGMPPDQQPYECRRCDGWHRRTDPTVKLVNQIRRTPLRKPRG